jgi:hypothetical protein
MIQAIIIARSISMLRRKTGIVIFVGKAARLVTNVIPMDAIARTKRERGFPLIITTATVNGVKMLPRVARAIPTHRSLDSC